MRQQALLKKQNEELRHNLDLAHATIRDLEQRLYGKKSEQNTTGREQAWQFFALARSVIAEEKAWIITTIRY